MTAPLRLAGALVALLAFATACGGSTSDDTSAESSSASGAPAETGATETGATETGATETGATETGAAGAGVRVVTPTDAAAIAENPPSDLVILDVRTAEEYAEGHLDGATVIDFYADDFADQIGELDPSVPYLLYCRSGSRSGQAAALMAELEFVDVADVDGGILAWADNGLEVTK